MRRKKNGLIFLFLLMTVGFGIRFYFVNRNVDLPVIQVYNQGETVAFENDFINYSEEKMNGYTMKVLDFELLQAEELYDRYSHTEEFAKEDFMESYADFYCVVKVVVGNVDNPYVGERGINLNDVSLVGTNYIMLIDDIGFELTNPEMIGLSFSLQQNSEMELILPYAVITSVHTDYADITKNPPKLLITEYPQQKMISLVHK